MINGWFTEVQLSHSYAEENDTDNVDVTFRSKTIDADDCGGPCGTFFYNNPQKVGLALSSYAQGVLYADLNVDAWEEDWSLIKDTETAFSVDMTKDGFTFMNAPTTVKYGFKYRSREKKGDSNQIEVDDDNVQALLQSEFGPYTRSWPFVGQQFGPHATKPSIC